MQRGPGRIGRFHSGQNREQHGGPSRSQAVKTGSIGQWRIVGMGAASCNSTVPQIRPERSFGKVSEKLRKRFGRSGNPANGRTTHSIALRSGPPACKKRRRGRGLAIPKHPNPAKLKRFGPGEWPGEFADGIEFGTAHRQAIDHSSRPEPEQAFDHEASPPVLLRERVRASAALPRQSAPRRRWIGQRHAASGRHRRRAVRSSATRSDGRNACR